MGLAQVWHCRQKGFGLPVTTSKSVKEMAQASLDLSALPVSVFADCHATHLTQALLSSYTTLAHL